MAKNCLCLHLWVSIFAFSGNGGKNVCVPIFGLMKFCDKIMERKPETGARSDVAYFRDVSLFFQEDGAKKYVSLCSVLLWRSGE